MIHKSVIEEFETIRHETDLCVVGGGIAGMLTALSAARHGARVVLMQDRPVLGGNASSEVRMWIRGAHGDNMRETGILEELALENIYRNPTLNYSIWDSVLYGIVQYQDNIELILNCSCNAAEMDGAMIKSIKGWQTTTQKWHEVRATLFADCSGDSVLAPLTGAEWRMGREARSEFGEDIAPEQSDNCTMGMSCLIQARETGRKVTYIPPKWAKNYNKDDFPFRLDLRTRDAWTTGNFWWMELGGVNDSIGDTEQLRDRLLEIAFGVWDFIKNSGACDADNWELDWVGFLPGKRESRRYVGDYIMTQEDVRAGGRFDDLIAYGGWTMDDHHPEGFDTREQPTIYHPAPSPFGIPYRCIYSKNIDNLLFAGRNISVSHTAFSATRVMATCGLVGQAAGCAAAIAIRDGILPRDVYHTNIEELKQMLMDDDCYLPYNKRSIPELTQRAELTADGEPAPVLINGVDRPVGDVQNCWEGACGAEIIVDLKREAPVHSVRIVFDSELNRESWRELNHEIKLYPQHCNVFADEKDVYVPQALVREFRIEGARDGEWVELYRECNNYQRLVKIPIEGTYSKIKFVPEKTWGAETVKLFALEVQ